MTSRTSSAIVAHLHRVRADDAELHREADRRAEVETVDAHARLEQMRRPRRAFSSRALMRSRASTSFGDDDDLGEGLRSAAAD